MHLLAEGETVVGRDSKAGLVLEDARISRRHAVLTRLAGRVLVADLGSRNGTFLNGRRLEGAVQPLAAGDVLKVGDFTLVFDPQEAILFAEDPAVAGMRAVLQKAPDEVILSGMVPAAGPAREVSAEGLRFELEKKTRVLGLFYELSRTLGSVFTLTDVYDKAIAILLQVTPAARVMIYQKAERGEMRHVASGARRQPVRPTPRCSRSGSAGPCSTTWPSSACRCCSRTRATATRRCPTASGCTRPIR
jgi:hypothetical protein